MLIDKARTDQKFGAGLVRMAWWLVVGGRFSDKTEMKCLEDKRLEKKRSRERQRDGWRLKEGSVGEDPGEAGGALASGTCFNIACQILLRTLAGIDCF